MSYQRACVVGTVTARGSVRGVVRAATVLGVAPYAGDYIVVPTWDAQTLPTTDRYLTADIDVMPIPVTRVSNESGGITATIG